MKYMFGPIEPDPEGGYRRFDMIERRYVTIEPQPEPEPEPEPEPAPVACTSCNGTGRIALLTSVVECRDCSAPLAIQVKSSVDHDFSREELLGDFLVGDTIRVKYPVRDGDPA